MILLNFTHPLPPEQLARLEQIAGQKVDRVIEIKTQIDPQTDLVPQVIALADACDLAPNEWQTESIVVVPPALNFVAVVLLAELHGRMGYFPAHIRTRPVANALPPRYEIAEVINLQTVRDAARQKR
jgi:hypothetical protein